MWVHKHPPNSCTPELVVVATIKQEKVVLQDKCEQPYYKVLMEVELGACGF